MTRKFLTKEEKEELDKRVKKILAVVKTEQSLIRGIKEELDKK